MKQVASQDPDILHFKSGGGPLVVVGLLFLSAGLFMLAISLGLVPVTGEPPPWYVAVFVGIGFSVTGLIMMFGRAELLIDGRRKRIVQRWWFLIPVRNREFMLDAYRRITIRREIKREKNSTRTVYPVSMEGGKGEDTRAVKVDEPLSYENARKTAETLARHLGLPIADSSAGTEIVRDTALIDESLRDRLREEGGTVDVPLPPVFIKASVREESKALFVSIPPSGMGPVGYMNLLPPLVFGIVVMVFLGRIFSDLPLPPRFRFMMSLLAVIFMVGFPLLLRLRAVMTRAGMLSLVTVTPAFLRVEKKAPLKKGTIEEMPADEIEELFVAGGSVAEGSPEAPRIPEYGRPTYTPIGPTARGRGPMSEGRQVGTGQSGFKTLARAFTPPRSIVARSDRATLTFGQGLPEEELRYLCALIKKAIAG